MTSGVVRVGDTVRRPARPWTPAVHALLGHRHAAGFHGAPRPVGLDERGREVLTFIPGVVAWPDNARLLDHDDHLRRVARLIREFHDAVEGFQPPPDAGWQNLIPAEGTGIIAHHDLTPWNLVIGADQWAFIDWDTAAPGSRLWDLAYALHGFVPLRASPALRAAMPSGGCGWPPTSTASRKGTARYWCPCWLGALGRCLISWPGRRRPAPSRGRGSGSKATARPGGPTPTTSPGTRTPGDALCWASCGQSAAGGGRR